MTRRICIYCETGPEECRACTWIGTRYPSKYTGKRFRTMEGMDKVLPDRHADGKTPTKVKGVVE